LFNLTGTYFGIKKKYFTFTLQQDFIAGSAAKATCLCNLSFCQWWQLIIWAWKYFEEIYKVQLLNFFF
jgi:hypothetical protein